MTAIANVPTAAATSSHRTELMSLDRALSLGESSWEGLRVRGGTASAFGGWAWHDAWAVTAPTEDRESAFALAAFDGNNRLSALLPLTTRRVKLRRTTATALTWAAGDLGCPDHLDVLSTPGAALDDIAAMLDTLDWDLIQLDGLVEGATGVRALQTALHARGIETIIRPLWTCPYISLPKSWDAYLAACSGRRRESIRRRERALPRFGRVSVTFYGPESHDEAWHHLLRLHDSRWEGDGAFNARLIALHRHFAAHLAKTGHTWLSTIDMDGEPIAAWYGFSDGGTLHYYQAGRAPEWAKASAGAVHLGMMIQRAIRLGLGRFDFLRGNEDYKSDWATAVRSTHQMIAFRRSARGRLLRLLDRVGDFRDRMRPSAEASV